MAINKKEKFEANQQLIQEAVQALAGEIHTLHLPTLKADPVAQEIVSRFFGSTYSIDLLNSASQRYFKGGWKGLALNVLQYSPEILQRPKNPWALKVMAEPEFEQPLLNTELIWLKEFLRGKIQSYEAGTIDRMTKEEEFRLFGIYNHLKSKALQLFEQSSSPEDQNVQEIYQEVRKLNQQLYTLFQPLLGGAIANYIRRQNAASPHIYTELELELLNTAAQACLTQAISSFNRTLGFRFSTLLYRSVQLSLRGVQAKWVKQTQASQDEKGVQTRWELLAAPTEPPELSLDDNTNVASLFNSLDWEKVFSRVRPSERARVASIFFLYYGVKQERSYSITEIAEKFSLTRVVVENNLLKAQRAVQPWLREEK